MEISNLIEQAMLEDLPRGDVTTDHLEIRSVQGAAQLVAKEDFVLSGLRFFQSSLHFHDPEAKIKWYFSDGDTVLQSQSLALIQCDLIKLLKAERVGLNFLGRFSGIATLTKLFTKALGESKTKILDTRKTTPMYRRWEKLAVAHGGGENHRMSLSDMAMLKENHLRLFDGDIQSAVKTLRKNVPQIKIVVETTNLEEVRNASASGCDRILLDNMDIATMAEAQTIIPPSIQTEASGNMTLDRIPEVAQLNLDFISVGAITHSAPCADISLIIDGDSPREST